MYLQTAAQDQRAADSPQHLTRRRLLKLQHTDPAGLLFLQKKIYVSCHHLPSVRKKTKYYLSALKAFSKNIFHIKHFHWEQ